MSSAPAMVFLAFFFPFPLPFLPLFLGISKKRLLFLSINQRLKEFITVKSIYEHA